MLCDRCAQKRHCLLAVSLAAITQGRTRLMPEEVPNAAEAEETASDAAAAAVVRGTTSAVTSPAVSRPSRMRDASEAVVVDSASCISAPLADDSGGPGCCLAIWASALALFTGA